MCTLLRRWNTDPVRQFSSSTFGQEFLSATILRASLRFERENKEEKEKKKTDANVVILQRKVLHKRKGQELKRSYFVNWLKSRAYIFTKSRSVCISGEEYPRKQARTFDVKTVHQ